jgi:hypothetical protein
MVQMRNLSPPTMGSRPEPLVILGIGFIQIESSIAEDDVFLRASFPLRFPRGSKFGILQKVTKETKSCGFYPGPSFPSLPSVKSERM